MRLALRRGIGRHVATPAPVWPVVLLGSVLMTGAAGIAVLVGSVMIPPAAIGALFWRAVAGGGHDPWPATYATILFDIRLPRVALMILTGAALASSGAAYQGLFRNPLADPYLIGAAAGAGLGAVFSAMLRLSMPALPLAAVPFGAFFGAALTVAAVYALGRVGGATPVSTLLLAGVALSALLSAATIYLLLRQARQASYILAFLLGGYAGGGWEAPSVVAPFVVIGFVVLYHCRRELNVLSFDDHQAQQLGVDVGRARLRIIIAATLMTGAAVAFSGLVGFIGLIVPHMARLLIGADHRRLLPLAALGGAASLVLADTLARSVVAPEELPLGVITAVAGVPFFLWMLRRARSAAFF